MILNLCLVCFISTALCNEIGGIAVFEIHKGFNIDPVLDNIEPDTISWTHNGFPIVLSAYVSVIYLFGCSGRHTVFANGTLRIWNASVADSGIYQCSSGNIFSPLIAVQAKDDYFETEYFHNGNLILLLSYL